jgi:hypothetical protein
LPHTFNVRRELLSMLVREPRALASVSQGVEAAVSAVPGSLEQGDRSDFLVFG